MSEVWCSELGRQGGGGAGEIWALERSIKSHFFPHPPHFPAPYLPIKISTLKRQFVCAR